MQDRREVLIVLFDLPSVTKGERADAARFRKELLKLGYTALQKSVYIKLLRGTENKRIEIENVRNAAPDGNIYFLPLSLNVFKKMKSIKGFQFDFSFFSDDVFIY